MPMNPIAAIVLRKSNPIVVDVELAVVLGDFELAAFLQQIQNALAYAEENPEKGFGKFKGGRWWYYERTGEWERKLPMWSRRKLYRMRKRLSEMGVLLARHEESPQAPGGVTCWYSIDENRLAEIVTENEYMRQRYSLGGSDKVSLPGPVTDRHNPLVTDRHNRTDESSQPLLRFSKEHSSKDQKQSGFAANAAAKTGLPAALPSALSSVPPRRRSEEKRVKSEEQSRVRIPAEDLTPLGKEIIALCGKGTALAVKPFLTQAQADKLSEEYSVPYKGKNYSITPDDLYASDDLYRAWIETEVYSTLRAQGGDKPLAKDKFISAVTMGGSMLNLSEFLAWRDAQTAKKEMEIALSDPSKVGEGRFSLLEEYENMNLDDEEEGDESE